jgi:hypothetical protein
MNGSIKLSPGSFQPKNKLKIRWGSEASLPNCFVASTARDDSSLDAWPCGLAGLQ